MMASNFQIAVIVTSLLVLPGVVSAAESQQPVAAESREFEILVSGKPAGKSAMVIAEFADGDTLVATAAEVRLNFVVYEYVYKFDGKERWRGDQLTSFECQAVDGRTKCATSGQLAGQGTHVVVNGAKPSMAPVFAMSTNYWRPPRAESLDQPVPIIDTDTGKTFHVKFHRAGQERLRLGKQETDCTHYQLSGDRKADLWFDGQNRLVRQACVEDGYPTEVRLTAARNLPLGDKR
jgi:hypothetical protein